MSNVFFMGEHSDEDLLDMARDGDIANAVIVTAELVQRTGKRAIITHMVEDGGRGLAVIRSFMARLVHRKLLRHGETLDLRVYFCSFPNPGDPEDITVSYLAEHDT